MAKRYCFTLNNYGVHEFEELTNAIKANCSYGIVGREVGASGTPHLQGFCMFTSKCRPNAAKDRLNPRCHVEIARGTPQQNRDYCSKDGDYWEHGECPNGSASRGRGTKDTIAREFMQAMESGRRGVDQFIDSRPGTYMFHGSQLLRNYLGRAEPINRPNIQVEWFYGAPGIGKSREAHHRFPDAYIKDPRSKWWNGYRLEKEVIIDDFGPNGIDINHLLRWFDRYKCYVEVKGEMVPLYAESFIVTSNYHPSDIFRKEYYQFVGDSSESRQAEHPQLGALLRRLQIIKFESTPTGYLMIKE